jgi:hypothetical protein
MSRRPVFAAVIVALAIGVTRPALADAVLDGLKTLPGSVEDVRVGGTWDQGGKSGIYRIIVSRSGADPITARLFIQWVAYDDSGGATVTSTTEIKEFAALNVDIQDFTSDSDSNTLTVDIQTLDPNSDNNPTYELVVTSPTQYKFGKAQN